MNELVGERLFLRRFNENDLNDFYEYAKDESIGPNAGWEPHKSLEVSKEILDKFIASEEVWAIVENNTNKVIGSIGLHNERKRSEVNTKMLGYVLAKAYHNQGYMSEAVKIIMKYAFDVLKIDILTVHHFPFNLASKRVIEKAGFKYEGTLRHASKIYNGNIYDDCCYSLLKEEYYQNNM